MNSHAVVALQRSLSPSFTRLVDAQREIREQLVTHANGKNLKGNEIVGWLGEIYLKTLLGGKLVDDSLEHDVETDRGWNVSVKTRKGLGKGWRRSSAIPKIEGTDCPSHLAFVHLDNEYGIDRIWLHEWRALLERGRFERHTVRGTFRSYFFRVDEANDDAQVIFRGTANQAL